MNDKSSLLLQIEKNIKICQKCSLCKTARNGVPGEGNVDSEVVFIGEAPGETEDATGRPFVGRAGKLLEKHLEMIGWKRSDVWIGNIIKHRPPENRDPLPEELAACSPFLTLQIDTIKPILIITLGRFSMNYFYSEGKISRDHGSLVKVGDYSLYPMYHPAAALRNPSVMKDFTLDFKNLPDVINNAKSSRSVNSNSLDNSSNSGQLGLGF